LEVGILKLGGNVGPSPPLFFEGLRSVLSSLLPSAESSRKNWKLSFLRTAFFRIPFSFFLMTRWGIRSLPPFDDVNRFSGDKFFPFLRGNFSTGSLALKGKVCALLQKWRVSSTPVECSLPPFPFAWNLFPLRNLSESLFLPRFFYLEVLKTTDARRGGAFFFFLRLMERVEDCPSSPKVREDSGFPLYGPPFPLKRCSIERNCSFLSESWLLLLVDFFRAVGARGFFPSLLGPSFPRKILFSGVFLFCWMKKDSVDFFFPESSWRNRLVSFFLFWTRRLFFCSFFPFPEEIAAHDLLSAPDARRASISFSSLFSLFFPLKNRSVGDFSFSFQWVKDVTPPPHYLPCARNQSFFSSFYKLRVYRSALDLSPPSSDADK